MSDLKHTDIDMIPVIQVLLQMQTISTTISGSQKMQKKTQLKSRNVAYNILFVQT